MALTTSIQAQNTGLRGALPPKPDTPDTATIATSVVGGLPPRRAITTVSAAVPPTHAHGGLPKPAPSEKSIRAPSSSVTAMTAAATRPYSERDDVHAFVDKLVNVHHFDRAYVEKLIYGIKPAITAPVQSLAAESSWWGNYRKKFLRPDLEQMGVDFADENDAVLAEVEKRYGVERHAILGIAGVETNYGHFTGKVPTLQALVRLAFDDDRRPEYFQDELEALFLLGRENNLDLKTLKGSEAGALGICQFMPSNYRRLAVSYSGTGTPDLWSAPDAAASIANYFINSDSAWQTGQPTAVRAYVDEKALNKALDKKLFNLNEVSSLATLRENGVTFGDTGTATTGRLMRMQLDENSYEYWLGLPNFETIRSYNHSNNYALAVTLLGETVAKMSKAQSSAHR